MKTQQTRQLLQPSMVHEAFSQLRDTFPQNSVHSAALYLVICTDVTFTNTKVEYNNRFGDELCASVLCCL